MSVDLLSPFAGFTTPESAEVQHGDASQTELQSPFEPAVMRESAEQPGEVLNEMFAQLADEQFTDALEALVDEAAAQQLSSNGASTANPSLAQTWESATRWIEPLAAAGERTVDQVAERLAGVDVTHMGAHQLDELLDSVQPEQLGVEGFDNFLGGWLGKIKNAVGTVVNKGLAIAGKFMPINLLLDRLKGLVRPLLNKLLRTALNLLPESVRPIARTLAGKLGITLSESAETDAVTRLAENLDLEIAAAASGEGERFESEQYEDEVWERRNPDARTDALAELDAARQRLAEQLATSEPGVAPVAELEQFLPVAMAVGPLLKLGVSMIGRTRIRDFLANRISSLISGMVGGDAATKIARPLADVGLRSLGMEVSPTAEDTSARTLAAEALASTVEGTVLRMLELPEEAYADELQLDAAVQSAFAEAAAAAMPDRVLRSDLPERETAQEGGAWILMPRATRPTYRYRQYSRVFAVPVSRQVARAVPWSDGASLESYLLDRGAQSWPVQAEVELFEAMPGTHYGHLGVDASEVQPLTPEVAGLLLNEPGIGRRLPAGWTGRRPAPGGRYYHVRTANGRRDRVSRPRHRVLVRLDFAAATPTVRIVLHLSERKAQQMLARLDAVPRDLPGALAALQHHYLGVLEHRVIHHLQHRKLEIDATRAAAVSRRITAAVTAALSAYLTEHAGEFAAAVKDPANGVAVVITFDGVTRTRLDADLPAGKVTVHPGWKRHHA